MAAALSDRRWWLAEKAEAHSQVCRIAEQLIEQADARHRLDLRHKRLYGNRPYTSLEPGRSLLAEGDRLSLNVIASAIDTASSKVAKNRPAPKFVPNGGDWSLRRKAKRLNKFGKGVLHASGAYRVRGQVFRDACIFGTGIAKVFSRDKQLRVERRFPWEILVDEQEAAYGEPRTLVERRYVDKAVLLDRFGGRKDSQRYRTIEDATPTDRDIPGQSTLSEQIELFEAWHLPSSDGAKDGRHVVVMEGLTLIDEPWTRPRFPFAVYRWLDDVDGWWGVGLAERLTGIQKEINKLLMRIQRAHHLLGIPWVILDEAAGIPETHVTNEIGAILVKNGGVPGTEVRVQVNQTIHPEIYAHLWTLEEKAYAQEGISQAYAQGRKPPGLNSGIAQRERNDIESERFILAGQRWEQWHMDLVELALDEVRDIGSSFSIAAPGRKWGERVKWGEVAMARDSYNLEVWPVSILPQTPAARLEKAQELFAAGLLPADSLAEVLDLPDVEKAHAGIVAMADWIEWAIDKMLDEGEPVPPEPYNDLELALRRVNAAYHEEMVQGAPEDRLQLLRDFMENAEALLSDAAQGPAMDGAAPMPPEAAAEAEMAGAAPPGLAAMAPVGTA